MINKIPYGLNRNGLLVHIDSVNNGIECECICPECKTPLIARNGGKKYIHHFAHVNTVSCNAGETILHLLSKDIFKESNKIYLPKVNYGNNLIQNECFYIYDECILEEKVDSIKPDITLKDESSILYVEIKVTHTVDEIKLNKVKQLNIPTLEIDISKFINRMFDVNLKDILFSTLINSPENKEWIYHPIIEKLMLLEKGNKYLTIDGYFDKDTKERVYPKNYKLSSVTSLYNLWIYNERKQFIALNTLDDTQRFYYIDREVSKKSFSYEAYKCEVKKFVFLNDYVPTQEMYLICKIVDYNKYPLFSFNRHQWKYIQDKPDELINIEQLKQKKELEDEEQISKNERAILSKITNKQIISRTKLSISEIWKLYELRYFSVLIQNIENMDFLLIKEGRIESDKYDFNDPKRVWINLNLNIYDDEF